MPCGGATYTKSKCHQREPTTGSHNFAHDIRRNLEQDVANIEHRENGIVVDALEMQVLLEVGETGVADVGSLRSVVPLAICH